MKCHDCGEDFPVSELMFTEDGKVPGLIMPRYKAQCGPCGKKIPIDDTTLTRREEVDDGAPF